MVFKTEEESNKHLLECPESMITCEEPDCEKVFKVKSHAAHRTEC